MKKYILSFFALSSFSSVFAELPKSLSIDYAVKKIIKAIKEDKLEEIFAQEYQPKLIDYFINNCTLAELAFEREVLESKQPVVCLFYKKNNNLWQQVETEWLELIKRYEEQIKFFHIDCTKYSRFAQEINVTDFPSVAIIHKRANEFTLEVEISIEDIETAIQLLLENMSNDKLDVFDRQDILAKIIERKTGHNLSNKGLII